MTPRFVLLTSVLGAAAGIAAAATVPAPLAAPMPMPGQMPPTAGAAPAVAAQQPSRDQLEFFESKIRPILVSNCYKCHSAEAGKAKGGLVLDTREGWQHGGDNGTAIVPGDPDKSLFVKAVSYTDKDLQMPPNAKLSDAELADLNTWIKMGAPDPRTNGGVKLTGLNDKAKAHWAYQQVKMPAVPVVHTTPQLVKTPIDNFILSKLETNELTPSKPASREVLIRRASYDLIGLPPTPEEVEAFVKDKSPDAWEKVIDRLLASPHYGERWGRFWLDSARYSDTTGLENLNKGGEYRYAYAWTYRDYVINAFNKDKPYNTFIREQLAADLLPTAKTDPTSLAALGFITVGKRFPNPNDTIDERIDALTKSTMALTVACARCHDHKFDPIPTADYYSLHGVFASLEEPEEKPIIGDPPNKAAFNDYKKKLAELEEKNADQYYSTLESQAKEFFRKPTEYLTIAVLYRGSGSDTQLRNKIIEDNKLERGLSITMRINPRDPEEAEIFSPLAKFAALKKDDYAAKADDIVKNVVERHSVNVDGMRAGGPARGKKGAPRPEGGRLEGSREINPLVVEAFKQVKPGQLKSLQDVTQIYGKLYASMQSKQKALVAANRAAKSDGAEIKGFTDDELGLLNFPFKVHPAYKLTTLDMPEAIKDLKLQNGGFNKFQGLAAVNELQLTHPGSPARAMVVHDARKVKDSNIFIRGEAQNRGPVVPRRFLEIIAGKDRKPFSSGAGRMELADAIASNNNPLTARVAVNRMWMHHFGEGIVRTVDDMGVMCDPPSHPELLDYLAGRFMADGWSYKSMHKLIMMSYTYQQSSDTTPAMEKRDPDNRMLWRANLRRLDFEAVRDTMLMFTGKLDRTIGGKPVNLTDEPYSNRRSVYGYIDRGSVPELMQQFDFADPDMANSHRTSTIVPQQALFFMNSPMAVDVARKACDRKEFVAAKDDIGRVKALYDMLFQRPPKQLELNAARDFVVATKVSTPDSVSKDAAKGAKKASQVKDKYGNMKSAIKNTGQMVERAPLDVWEKYAQALLMTNEIAYVN